MENQTTATQNGDPQDVVRAYLQAFDKRDVDSCLGFFADDATLMFMGGTFKGRQAIEEWHKERFNADLKVTNVGALKMKNDLIQVDVTVTSKRLKAFLVNSMGGHATVRLDAGEIRELWLVPRMTGILGGR